MSNRNNMKDILTPYYEVSKETIKSSENMKIPIEDIAEMKVNISQDTLLYDTVMRLLKEDAAKYCCNK